MITTKRADGKIIVETEGEVWDCLEEYAHLTAAMVGILESFSMSHEGAVNSVTTGFTFGVICSGGLSAGKQEECK
jgi:hypothetical protein